MKKGILGILGSVLTAVMIFWLTDGLRDSFRPSQPSIPSQPQSYHWDGRVIDRAKAQLLSNVDVSLDIRGTRFTDKTDSEGRYIFIVYKSVEPFIAVLNVAAQGYEPFTRKLTVDSNGVLERQSEVGLTLLAPAPTDASAVLLPRPRLMEKAASIVYKPRSAESAVKTALPVRTRGGG